MKSQTDASRWTSGLPSGARKVLGVGPSVVTRLGGAVAQVAVQVLAANIVGLWAVAVYGSALAWTRVAGNAVAQGYPTQILRDAARLENTTGLGLATIGRRIGGGTLAIGVLALLVSPLLVQSLPIGSALVIAGLVASAGSYAMLRCLSERSKAAGAPARSLYLEFVVPPAVTLNVLLALAATGGTAASTRGAALVVASIPLGYVVASLGLWVQFKRRFVEVADHDPTFNMRLAVIGVTNPSIGAIPLLVAPAFVSVDQVAWLTVGLRLVAVPTLVFTGLAAFFAPRFSAAAAAGQIDRLKRLFSGSQVLAFGVYLPVAVVLLVVPGLALSAFGIDARGAETLLRLLVVAQGTNAITGLTSEFLTMADQEVREFNATSVGAAVAIVGVTVGGWLLGINGVALGFALALATRFLLSWVGVRRTLRSAFERAAMRTDQVFA